MILLARNRLKKNADFLYVLRGKTKKVDAAFGKLLAVQSGFSAIRFGFVASKKVSPKSVTRNLLKRRAREWIRKHIAGMRSGYDVVLIFGDGAPRLSRRLFYEELERACERAGILKR